MEVCKYGNRPQVAVALLQLGANPNIISKDGHTALGYAVERRDVEIVRALLAHGAHPHVLTPQRAVDMWI